MADFPPSERIRDILDAFTLRRRIDLVETDADRSIWGGVLAAATILSAVTGVWPPLQWLRSRVWPDPPSYEWAIDYPPGAAGQVGGICVARPGEGDRHLFLAIELDNYDRTTFTVSGQLSCIDGRFESTVRYPGSANPSDLLSSTASMFVFSIDADQAPCEVASNRVSLQSRMIALGNASNVNQGATPSGCG